jgi:hypothetical protein
MNEESPEFRDEKLLSKITRMTKGLVYTSETDADVEPFAGGAVTGDDVAAAVSAVDSKTPIEEIAFDDLFGRLTAQQDWFGPREKKRAERFARLQRSIEENLRGIKVLKLGRIQKTIYVAGISPNNNLLGVKMDAVET